MFVNQKKSPLLLGILLLTLSHLSDEIDIETSEYSDPLAYNCDRVHFNKETYVRCTCLDGIWAVLIAHPYENRRQWKLYGVDKQCVHIGQWVTKIHKLSSSAIQTTLSILPLERESESLLLKNIQLNENGDYRDPKNETSHVQYVVTNTNNWQLTTLNDDGIKETICLPAAGLSRYCTYLVSSTAFDNLVDEKEILEGQDCYSDSKRLYPVICDDLLPQSSSLNDEPLVCNLIPPKSSNHLRNKRQVTGKPIDSKEIDEDYIGDSAKYAGDKSFMSSIMHYVVTNVIKLSGLKNDDRPSVAILPVSNLLLKSVLLMRKICNPIKNEVWDIALGTFLRHQKNVLHMKEPYIGYAAYQRILHTLETCLDKSTPFVFQEHWTIPDNGDSEDTQTNIKGTICETETSSSDALRWYTGHFKRFKKIYIPAFSDPLKHEPLIETVWKAFVTTHTHCFQYFSDYYNDHHTFTVSIMPFFTNQIQDIWLLSKDSPETADETILGVYNDSKIWYGGLLGDTSRLFYHLDNCYGAARGLYNRPETLRDVIPEIVNRYPWQMMRPLFDKSNQWTRKKDQS